MLDYSDNGSRMLQPMEGHFDQRIPLLLKWDIHAFEKLRRQPHCRYKSLALYFAAQPRSSSMLSSIRAAVFLSSVLLKQHPAVDKKKFSGWIAQKKE